MIPVKADIRNISSSDFDRPFDVVFTNPPYMKSGNGLSNIKECKNIARHEENGEISDFVLCAANILKFGGHFYAVYRPDRICDLLSAMRDNSLEPKRITFIYPRADAKPCLVLTECKKGAGSSAVITKPLIMYDDDGQYTQDLKYIYEYGEFNEQY